MHVILLAGPLLARNTCSGCSPSLKVESRSNIGSCWNGVSCKMWRERTGDPVNLLEWLGLQRWGITTGIPWICQEWYKDKVAKAPPLVLLYTHPPAKE